MQTDPKRKIKLGAPEKPTIIAADELYNARVLAAFTQAEAAERIGVSKQQWSQWETGVAGVPEVHVKAIRKLLKLKASTP